MNYYCNYLHFNKKWHCLLIIYSKNKKALIEVYELLKKPKTQLVYHLIKINRKTLKN